MYRSGSAWIFADAFEVRGYFTILNYHHPNPLPLAGEGGLISISTGVEATTFKSEGWDGLQLEK
jgi:hypothetical protein